MYLENVALHLQEALEDPTLQRVFPLLTFTYIILSLPSVSPAAVSTELLLIDSCTLVF